MSWRTRVDKRECVCERRGLGSILQHHLGLWSPHSYLICHLMVTPPPQCFMRENTDRDRSAPWRLSGDANSKAAREKLHFLLTTTQTYLETFPGKSQMSLRDLMQKCTQVSSQQRHRCDTKSPCSCHLLTNKLPLRCLYAKHVMKNWGNVF